MKEESKNITEEERALIIMMRSIKVQAHEVMHFVQEGLKRGGGKLQRAERCLELGEQEMKRNRRTVSFAQAVEAAAEEKKERRARTQSDFRQAMRRLMRECPQVKLRRVRSIRSEECAAWLERAYTTPSQRKKARVALSSVFSTAKRRGWCSENPIRSIPVPHIREKSISILSKEELSRLMHTAETFNDGSCLAPLAIMLYAGVRPNEVERLCWGDVRLENGRVLIAPRHSKTGGARHVTIFPPLARILQRIRRPDAERICPPNWRRLQTLLHHEAGFTAWQPDVLRHTFATHHLATFRNYAELQLEMGHRSAELLRTRYIAMEGMYHHENSLLVN